MLRCKELGLSVDDLENIDFGLVQDMLTERANDEHKWPYKATQKDFDNFNPLENFKTRKALKINI